MWKLLTFPHIPSVGKLKTIFKIIFKTIFFFGIGLLFFCCIDLLTIEFRGVNYLSKKIKIGKL